MNNETFGLGDIIIDNISHSQHIVKKIDGEFLIDFFGKVFRKSDVFLYKSFIFPIGTRVEVVENNDLEGLIKGEQYTVENINPCYSKEDYRKYDFITCNGKEYFILNFKAI